MKLSKYIFIAAIAMLQLTSCSDSGDNNRTRTNISLTPEQQIMTQDANEFAVDALKAVNDTGSNVALSPYGLQLSLAMIANGANGETLGEITTALHLSSTTVDALNDYYKTVTNGLINADNRVTINFQSALWTAKNLTVNSNYENRLKDTYGTTSSSIDFSSPDALKTINQWASSASGNKTNNLFDYLDPNTVMCIVNTMNFDGIWSSPMAEITNGEFAKFTDSKGKEQDCEKFGGTTSVHVSSDADADMVELDYGNGAFVMDVLQPKHGESINEFVADLTSQKISSYISGLKSNKVILYMPKFETTQKHNLIEVLETLGIKKIFGGGDLTGIVKADFAISQYVQQLYVKVDKEGTKISVSTGSSGNPTAMIGNIFNVDGPFIYMVRERSTGAILLIGKVQTMAGMQ